MSRKNKTSSKVKVNKEVRKEMITAIKTYFSKERDEEIGDLAASLILDFFLEELAPHIYNQGVYASYRYMEERTEDLLGILKY